MKLKGDTINLMKKINILYAILLCSIGNTAYAAGLKKTTLGMKDLQTAIHTLVGVVFLITGVIVGALIWRGNKTWEECSKWVLGIAFAGGAAELIGIFYS